MRQTSVHPEDVAKLLEERGPVTTKELTWELDCSRATLYVKLKEIPYITSCNNNGKYHALEGMAEYDRNGIWRSGEVVFSKWRSLKETIRKLVESSTAGLSGRDLESILITRVTSQLPDLSRTEKIARIRYGRRYIYFSVEPEIRKSQMERRRVLIGDRKKTETSVSKDRVIKVLSALVKHQAVSFEDAMQILSSEGISVTVSELRWIFEKYGLKKRGQAFQAKENL